MKQDTAVKRFSFAGEKIKNNVWKFMSRRFISTVINVHALVVSSYLLSSAFADPKCSSHAFCHKPPSHLVHDKFF